MIQERKVEALLIMKYIISKKTIRFTVNSKDKDAINNYNS